MKCSKHKSKNAIFKCKCGKRFCKTCAEDNKFIKKYSNEETYGDCLCGMTVKEC